MVILLLLGTLEICVSFYMDDGSFLAEENFISSSSSFIYLGHPLYTPDLVPNSFWLLEKNQIPCATITEYIELGDLEGIGDKVASLDGVVTGSMMSEVFTPLLLVFRDCISV